jgi:hypothetical protein
MRLMFVYWAFEDQGSGLVIQGYSEAARALGHEVAVYGRPNPKIPLNYSLDVESADAIVFIFEWTTRLIGGDELDLLRLVSKVPRRRRIILDGDGNYNDIISVDCDYNHREPNDRAQWIAICESLSDKICQPTFHPRLRNVRPFLFYSYNPEWEQPTYSAAKEFSMIYVGHSKFRWLPIHSVLRAMEPVRPQLGRVALLGYGWEAPPPWAVPMHLEEAYYSDPAYLEALGVEIFEPVAFGSVIDWMSKATFNPVVTRPTFAKMRLVTPRFFETLAADTFPIFVLHPEHVAEIYGPEATEMVLGNNGGEMFVDMERRPHYYCNIVRGIRQHLTARHSQVVRLKELVDIIES